MISVIVPVYNVEKYIEKCVESILSQDYPEFELILVDDGSTDASGAVCDQYKNFKNVHVIHKTNGGLSDARNAGIEEASGEYLTFIDSDDFIQQGYLSYLYDLLTDYNASMAICAIQRIPGKQIKEHVIVEMGSIQAIEYSLYQRYIDVSACAKLYRRELFDGVRFPIGMLYEDLATTYKLYARASNIVYGSGKSYYYVERSDSIIHSKLTIKEFDVIGVMNELEKNVVKLEPGLKAACDRRKCLIYYEIMKKQAESNANDEVKKIVRDMKEDIIYRCKVTSRDQKASFKDRIKAIILFFRTQAL